ncbi:hypothetical protein ACFL9U_12415, partial [Thermodesulfobacteriota bacterium]
EERVKALEEKLTGLKNTHFEQEHTIEILGQVVHAWMAYSADQRRMILASYEADPNLAALNEKLREQESRLVSLTGRLDEMAGRLSDLEKSGTPSQPLQKAETPKATVPYTGLVIDARDTGFRPCLKPEIYVRKRLIYPGEYLDMNQAIRRGYVRYYRKVGRAQQSARVGSLPYTIKAKGIYKGKRNLEIESEASQTLQAIIGTPDNFMAEGKVVIVF